jgi:hypothetical protein
MKIKMDFAEGSIVPISFVNAPDRTFVTRILPYVSAKSIFYFAFPAKMRPLMFSVK